MNKTNSPKEYSLVADKIVESVKGMLGEDMVDKMEGSGFNINYLVRFIPLSSLCRNRRKEKRLSIKKISSQLRIPQYKLKYIEEDSINHIQSLYCVISFSFFNS